MAGKTIHRSGLQGDRQRPTNPDVERNAVPMDIVATILRLHAQGRSKRQIAIAVNRSYERVRQILDREYQKVVVPVREEARKAASLRLAGLLATAYDMVDGTQGELRLKAIDRALRVEEQIARLYGTNAPIKINATVREVDATDDELAELIREEQAKAARGRR
jgi:hypothetical protein